MVKRTRPKSAKAPVEADNISLTIIQLVHDAIIAVDEDQKIILFNQGAEQIFGYQASEVIGQRLEVLLPPQVSDFHAVYIRSFAKDPETARLMGERKEVSGKRKNGAIFPAEASISKISSGGRIFFTAILRDITERKLAEQTLRESEEKQNMVLNGVDEIIYQVNYPEGSSVVNGIVEFVSERTQEVLGYRPTDFIADPNRWFSLIHPDDIPIVQAQTIKIYKTGQPGLRHYRIKDRNGEYRWVEDRVSPEKDKTGRVVRTFGVARDVTERKRAEEALLSQETRFRALIENGSDAIALISADGKILYESPAVARVLGYAVGERTGRAFFELVHPDDLPGINNRFAQLLRQPGVTIDAQLRYRHKDGSWRWLEAVGQNLLAEPSVQAIVANYRDITERKQVEGRLQESEEHFRTMFEQAAVGIAHVSTEGGWLLVNQRLCDIVGYTRDELLGLTFQDITHLDDLQTDLTYVQQLLADEIKTYSMEKRYIRKDRSIVWINLTVSLVRETSGEPKYFISVVEDITERKRTEENLRQSEEKFRKLTETLPIGIAVTTPKGETLEANPALVKMSGYDSKEEFLQAPAVIHYLNPEDRSRYIAQLLERGAVLGFEMPLLRKDGSVFWASASSVTQKHPDGSITLVHSVEDISERKRAEAERAQLLNVLESSLNEIYIFDAETLRFQYVNQGALRNLGYTREAMSEMTPLDLKPEFDLDSFRNIIKPLLHRKQEKVIFQTLHRRADGSLYPAEVHLQMSVFNGKGVFHAVILDITERKQAEEENTKLYNALEQSADIIFITDRDGIIEYVNPAFETITGYSKEESIGKSPNIMSSGLMETEHYQKLWETILSGEVFRGEIIDRKKGDGIFYYDQTITPLKDEHGNITHFVSTGKDVTERKRAEERIETQLKRLASLHTIDIAITASTDLKFTLKTALDQAVTELGVDAASVLLLNPSTHTLKYSAGRGFRSNAYHRTQVRLGDGQAGKAALEREIVACPDFTVNQPIFAMPELMAGERFAAYYAVPLIAKGFVIGVLEIFHRAPLHPDDEWLNFLETIAGQVAIAINNAHLFEGLQQANTELTRAYDATIAGWSQAMDLRDKETEGHTQRVTAMAERLSRAMGMSNDELVHMRRGALLHDIGKMGVPDGVLLKPDKLTDEEWVLMKKHPQFAFDMLSSIAYLKPALDIPYCHHEKWDGSGYPQGLEGEHIPLVARIFSVVDVWDALRSDRPYRKGWSEEKTLEHIRSLSGVQFDPKVVDVFLLSMDNIDEQ